MKKPNVLFFMMDQVSGEVLRPESPCRTPNLDRIIERGVRVERAYTPSPICTPARASIMTGLLPHRHGATQVHLPPKSDPDIAKLKSWKRHWAQQLNDAGYRTGHWGKWHVDYHHNVNRYGWEQWDPGETMHSKPVKRVWQIIQPNLPPGYGKKGCTGPTDIPLEERPQWRHFKRAAKYLDEVIPSGDPWCCMMSFVGPHSSKDAHIDLVNEYLEMDLPLPVSRNHDLNDRPEAYRLAQSAFRGLTDEDHRKWRACYYAAVEEHDRMFGMLLDKVEESGQLDNTIVIFVTDHGDALGAHGIYTKILFSHEPVYNVPMAICGPGIAKGKVTNARVGSLDLCPTLLELTGCDPIENIDGHSAAALFADPEKHESEWTFGFAQNWGTQLLFSQRILWDDNWKLVYNGFGISELYNLEKDPDEMVNRINDPECSETLKKLAIKLWSYIKEKEDTEFLGTPPCFRFFPYGPNIGEEEKAAD